MRLAFNILAAGSLALCVAAATLWVRSHFASDTLSAEGSDGPWVARVGRGRAWVFHFAGMGGAGGTGPRLKYEINVPAAITTDRPPWAERYWHTPVFTFCGGGSGAGVRYWHLIVPLWAPAVVFAALPAWWATGHRSRRRRQRRKAAGLCERCGYDLRATPGRCPECGQATAPAAAPA